jgi:hypothetical protein
MHERSIPTWLVTSQQNHYVAATQQLKPSFGVLFTNQQRSEEEKQEGYYIPMTNAAHQRNSYLH